MGNYSTLIKQVRVIDPGGGYDERADVLIKDGLVAAIGDIETEAADKVIMGSRLWAMPGIVDVAVHPRDFEHAYKATVASESKAALAAGVTTFCCPPDMKPVTDSPATVRLIQERAKQAGYNNVKVIAALSVNLAGEKLSNMAALAESGCVGFSNVMAPFANSSVLKKSLEYAAGLGFTVFFQPFDQGLASEGCAHDGVVAARCGLPGIPSAAETAALAQYIEIVKETGVKTHICRLSSARSVALLSHARQLGLNISADVAAHQMLWNEEKLTGFDPNFNLLPPLRSENDRKTLLEAVSREDISVICSDHQPHELGAKLSPFPSSQPGISSLETLVPICLELARGGAPLLPLLAALTCNPARLLNLDCGRLSVGAPADLCLVDPDYSWTVNKNTWFSKGENTPFWNKTLKGKVACVFVDGRLAYQANFFANRN